MDQGDADDLMQLSRAAARLRAEEVALSEEGDAALRLLASRQHRDRRSRTSSAADYPQFLDYREDLDSHLRRLHEPQGRAQSRRLRRPAALLGLACSRAARSSGNDLAGLYDHVLVDEYQDTNRAPGAHSPRHGARAPQHHRRRRRRPEHLLVPRRDASATSSISRSIFPGRAWSTLEQNYRSTQPILDVTNTLISRARERYTKNLWTHARTVARRPGSWRRATSQRRRASWWTASSSCTRTGTPLREIAVLFRAGYMSADLEIELTNRKIPFEKWGGLKFLEAAHVKDVLAFLRILENPRDEVSWYRVLLLLPGIGDATARAAVDAMAQMAWESSAFGRFTPPARARAAHAALVQLLDELRDSAELEGRTLTAEIARVRRLYDDILRERYDRPEPRLADLDQLEVIAAGFPSRAVFLSALALEPPSSTQDLAGAGDRERRCARVQHRPQRQGT